MAKFSTQTQYDEESGSQLSITHKSSQIDQGQLDSQMWEAFRNDSRMAYKWIYLNYADLLYNYGLKIIPNDDLVKDSIQDLFIELWNRRKNLTNVNSIKAYLMVGFRRKIIERKKKLQRFQSISEIEKFEINFSSKISFTELGIAEERREGLLKALNLLPERQKEAIFLRFYNKLTCKEIGEILEVNAQSVYNLIHRALKMLRNELT